MIVDSLTSDDQGFTLAELLVSSLIALSLLAGMVALANPAGQRARVEPDALDLLQRVRAGLVSLDSAVRSAGAGPRFGGRAGGLTDSFAVLLPRRIGTSGGETFTVARPDVLSVLTAPVDAIETTLAVPFTGSTATLQPGPECRAAPGCGLSTGTAVVIFDGTGQVDLFTVTAAIGADVQLRPRGGWSSAPYPAGSSVIEVLARTYYFDKAARQLREYDTDLSDAPVLDDIVGLSFEYFGTGSGATRPAATPGVANCLYDAAGTRLPSTELPADDAGLARLSLSLFADGPWCGTGPMQFDADLLRVRRVRVQLTGQVSSGAARGRGLGFAAPGTSQSAWTWEPDLTMAVEVAPVNLDLR